ncbi:MAG: tripartite tricarboxylate transporter permease [Deltaproteobacteria bacterium]|nr:tripartite tricarboxylate transporter permease [Deltaproteobacteria bacterium]
MEPSLYSAVIQGFNNIIHAHIFLAMAIGVSIGTFTAVAPQGFGTPLAYALLLPIIIKWSPLTGIALLIGVSSVSAICAAYLPILFGIPGGAGSQATILDGYPMGRRGEARRALGASFMAGGMGALIGTIMLFFSVPIAQPLIYLLGSPELAVIIFWGLTMIACLAGREPLKGVIAAFAGLLLSTIGQQEQSGVMRYVFDQIYLLDGFTLSIVALAMFGIPASLNLALTKVGVEVESAPLKGSLLDGIKDTIREWWLVLRCSGVGVWVGLVPGIGAQTVDWLAYGHAAQSCKGAKDTFGKGDVRGVIAPESANDAKDGGDLMSVLLLGIPQGTTTALFIVALLAWGFVPGPEMVRKHADLIFSIIWIQGISAILGTLIGFVLSNQLAKLAQIRYTILVPLILTFILLGAFSANRDALDLVAVVSFGILGYFMWRLGYPRPALILGFVLGTLFEKYLYRSVASYGFTWLSRPGVIILLILALGTLLLTLVGRWKTRQDREAVAEKARLTVRFRPASLLTAFFLIVFVAALVVGWKWPLIARLMPVYVVAVPGLVLTVIQLFRDLVAWENSAAGGSQAYQADEVFDIKLEKRTEIWRTGGFFAWFAGGATAIWLLGMVVGLPLLILLYTFIEGKENWKVSVGLTASIFLLIWGLFEYILMIRWPAGALFQ